MRAVREGRETAAGITATVRPAFSIGGKTMVERKPKSKPRDGLQTQVEREIVRAGGIHKGRI